MKKKYISPLSESIDLTSEHSLMVTNSPGDITIDSGTTANPNSMQANKKNPIWGTSLWDEE
ncbi:MAG: hypothetical protein Q4E59_02575 [Bacteroidales bacterium]|nr:hypothetical protein [Bacteroidales bacterium]